MSLLRKSLTVFDHAVSILAFIGAVILLFIMLSIGSDVVMRYFFKQPQIWVLEITEYSLLFMTFLSTAWLLKNGGHVKMDLVLLLFKPRTRVIINIFTTTLLAILFLVITWYGVKVTYEQFEFSYFTSTPLEVPTGPLMSVIPIGCFLLFIQTLRTLCEYIGALTNDTRAEK
ncbi:TRAP transporter small permease subunit [Thermodesulfobacteriota bacterium]